MLNIFYGKDLKGLADRLFDELGKQTLKNPLSPELFVVQNHGIARWLSLRMARKENIAANLKFEFPSERIWSLIRLLHPDIPGVLPSDRGPLTWSIMRLLQDDETLSEFDKLRYYLQHEDAAQQAMRTWKLSTKIADVLDQYLVYRPDLILDWEQNERKFSGAERWQAALWNKLIRLWKKKINKKWLHRAQLQKELLEAIAAGTLNPDHLPQRLTIFGVSHMPTVFIRIIVKLSTMTDIQIFQLLPNQQTDHTAFDNPLLSILGKQGTDYQQQLTACIDDMDEAVGAYHAVPDDSSNQTEKTVLQQVKKDIGRDQMPEQKKWQPDPSLQVHSCHSATREAEVLYDQLLAVFDQNPDMSPDDILIMTPDMETYVPVIKAVFGESDDGQPQIPFTIADQHNANTQEAVKAFLHILELTKSRFKVADMVDLLHKNPIKQQFDFSDDDLGRLERWIADNRIRWGINGVFKQKMELPATQSYTWEAGLNRMVLGYMMKPDDEHLYNSVYPFDEIETSEDAALAGRFSNFLNILFSIHQACEKPAAPEEWTRRLSRICDTFLPDDRDYFWQLSQIRSVLNQLEQDAALGDYNREVPFHIIRMWINNQLEDPSGGGMPVGRGVTFSSLVAMRSIPYKMIGMLGMNEGAFPRTKIPIEFDLMYLEPRPGDPVSSDEDRQLFLENLWSAQTHIYFSYVGQSNREDTKFPPSVILKTFMDYLYENYGLQEDEIITKHPLQAFNAAYFRGNSLFSYSQTQQNISQQLLDGNGAINTFFVSALPEPEKEWKTVTVNDLISFFRHPAKFMLQQRLGIYLRASQPLTDDREPFKLRGLDNYTVGQELLNRYMNDESLDSYKRILRSRDLLPDGWTGDHAYQRKIEQVREFGDNIRAVLEQDKLDDCDIHLEINGFTLTGTLSNIYAQALLQYRFGKGRPKDLVDLWISHLVFQLAKPDGHPGYSQLFARDKKKPVVDYRLSPTDEAKPVLAQLLDIYWQGLQNCCYFFPDISYAFAEQLYSKNKKVQKALDKASARWKNEFSSYPNEGDDPYNKLMLGSENPLEKEEFKQVAETVWAPFFDVLNKGGR